jgi:hypothetical protein
MTFFKALAAWLMIGAILGFALFLAVAKGMWLALVAAIIAFVVALGKIGCAVH